MLEKKQLMKRVMTIIIGLCFAQLSFAETGYDLWLRYNKIDNNKLYNNYREVNKQIVFPTQQSETLEAAHKELARGLKGLLDLDIKGGASTGTLVVGTPQSSSIIVASDLRKELESINDEGYIIRSSKQNGKPCVFVVANTDIGVLYGVFHYLRLMQTHQSLDKVSIKEEPKIQQRMLNHWDNLSGTIERGYAGYTLWDWQRLPGYVDERMVDYARANASLGINGIVLNNVNSNSKSLSLEYIIKTKALADVFRPYGIKVYLTAKFSAPRSLSGFKTADPLEPAVRQWWKDKAKQIYEYIPNFGGFLVKANSEGQPGPQDYGRTHADGANMMAEALEPYGGIVLWRAFVYQNERHIDRALNNYEEFKPLDGKFNKNVFVQPKNGAIDFQPREPFHPLFGSMPNTPLAIEFQITQEYLGYSSHLAYLAPLFEETLDSETYANGKGSTVGKVIAGYQNSHGMSAMAGVPNVGTDMNWTGHLFGQANWHAFGRLAWNPEYSSSDLANEWIRMTFGNDLKIVNPIKDLMLYSREAVVNYMTPLGLNHIMDFNTHYGPGPWFKDPGWDARDYHKVDEEGLGVDRTINGSNVVGQYNSPLREQLNDIKTCPENLLLFFHHVPWDYKMSSGRTMWDELVHHYYLGVDQVRQMRKTWNSMEGKIDNRRFNHVKELLKVQEDEAIWWRDACVLYFQTFSKRPISTQHEQPKHSLEYYKKIPYPYDWKESQYK